MSPEAKKISIVVLIVVLALIVWYYVTHKSGAVIGTTQASTTPNSDPSQPAGVSQQTASDQIYTGAPITGSTSTFVNDGQSNAAVTGGVADPLTGLLPGFQTWVNSLGPINKPLLIAALPNISATDMQLVNNIVTNNLWGNPSVASSWNNFVLKLSAMGIPKKGTKFSNFSKSR